MPKWQYATLWFIRASEGSSVSVELRTSGEPKKLGTTFGSRDELSQGMMYWLDFLGDEGWEAYSYDSDRFFFRRQVE